MATRKTTRKSPAAKKPAPARKQVAKAPPAKQAPEAKPVAVAEAPKIKPHKGGLITPQMAARGLKG